MTDYEKLSNDDKIKLDVIFEDVNKAYAALNSFVNEGTSLEELTSEIEYMNIYVDRIEIKEDGSKIPNKRRAALIIKRCKMCSLPFITTRSSGKEFCDRVDEMGFITCSSFLYNRNRYYKSTMQTFINYLTNEQLSELGLQRKMKEEK